MVVLLLSPVALLVGFLFFNHRIYWMSFAVAVTAELIGLIVLVGLGAPRAGGASLFDEAVVGGLALAVLCLAIVVIGAIRARRAMVGQHQLG